LTAKLVDYLEEKAYNVAQRELDDTCFASNILDKIKHYEKKNIIPVSDLFDMVAGSETGAIIGGALITPKDPEDATKGPRNSGADVVKWFRQEVDFLYRDVKMSGAAQFFLFIFIMALAMFIAETCAQRCCLYARYRAAYLDLKLLYDYRKAEIVDQKKMENNDLIVKKINEKFN